MFDYLQVHVNFIIHLNLEVLYAESLDKLTKSILWMDIHKVVHPSQSCVPQRPWEESNFCTFLGDTIEFYVCLGLNSR
jgi:hypothetical protein